jgi:hypothetical protein
VVHVTGFVPGFAPDLRLGTARRLLERDLKVVAEVRAAIDAARTGAATAAATAEQVAEDVPERIGETAEAGAAHSSGLIDARVPELVVGGALLRVRQDLVGFLRLLELLFGVLVLAILRAIRMMLHRELAKGLLDLVFRSVAVDAQHLVEIAFGHDGGCS